MLLTVHKIWHGISPERYRQVLTKINQNYICQQGNILLVNLRVLDLVGLGMSRSHVKGHRRGGVCVLRMLLVIFFFFYVNDYFLLHLYIILLEKYPHKNMPLSLRFAFTFSVASLSQAHIFSCFAPSGFGLLTYYVARFVLRKIF